MQREQMFGVRGDFRSYPHYIPAKDDRLTLLAKNFSRALVRSGLREVKDVFQLIDESVLP